MMASVIQFRPSPTVAARPMRISTRAGPRAGRLRTVGGMLVMVGVDTFSSCCRGQVRLELTPFWRRSLKE